MDIRLILVLLLVFASVEVLGRKKGKKNKRRFSRRFPKPYPWMHYTSNYDPTVEENGCVDIRPQCGKWAQFPGYCGYARGYMIRHCKKSCRLCRAEDDVSIGKTSGVGNSYNNEICEDLLEDCRTYVKSQSQCNLFDGRLMKKYCRKTCGFCCFDILSDCSVFIKKPSQCTGLNGFFRKYCSNTCQMCGFLLPVKKPGCQDELDDCKAFTPEECQIRKSFGSKYCAKTCGFCEDQGYSPEGTTQPVVHPQHTYGPTNEEITQETSPSTDSTPREVTRVFQGAVNTRGTTGNAHQRETSPNATTTYPADSRISSKTTKIHHKATTLSDSRKNESVTTDSKTDRTITSEDLPQTTASSSKNIFHTTTSTFVTQSQDTMSKPTKATSSLEVKTDAAKSTDVTETNSQTSFSDSIATSVPSSTTETGFPTTSDNRLSESPSLAQASSTKVQNSADGAETTRKPAEITTDYKSTVRATSNAKQEAIQTTAPSVFDRVPNANTARSTENLDTKVSSSKPRVTTDIPSTARPDSYASSPSTKHPVPNDTSPTTENADTIDPNFNTGSPVTEAPSPGNPKTDIKVATPSEVTEAQTSAEESTAEVKTTVSSTERPITEIPSTVTENQDVEVDDTPTTVPLNTRQQNIDAVARTTILPTTIRSHLRSKTKKSVCVDKLKECANYVKDNINYCKYHVHFMHEYCSKSCGFCGHDKAFIPKCEDERKNKCQYFSRYVGYCTVNKKYMRKRCPKSCGFCGVAPGSPPMDRTFVRANEKYEFSILTEWDGKPIKHAPIKFKLSAEDNTNVRLEVSGPLFNQPAPPPCAAGQPCWQLWNYEVAEMFFLGEKEKYLELEVSPHGPHLLLLLDGVRKPFKTKLPMRYSASKDLNSMTWNGTAIVPLDYFPPGMRKINAYAIHGPDNNKIYESLYPASKTAYPDFHRLDFFKDFDFKSMFPSGWNQPISPLWLRSK